MVRYQKVSNIIAMIVVEIENLDTQYLAWINFYVYDIHDFTNFYVFLKKIDRKNFWLLFICKINEFSRALLQYLKSSLIDSKITYFQIFAFLSYTVTFVSNLASVLFESRYWLGNGDFKATNDYHDNYKQQSSKTEREAAVQRCSQEKVF